MKKNILRIVSLALVAIMMLLAVGCNALSRNDGKGDETWPQGVDDNGSSEPKLEGGEETKATEKQTQKETEKQTDDEEDLDFDGAEIKLLFRDYIANSREWRKDVIEDELDEAIALRNTKVEQDLNVKIVWKPVFSDGNDYNVYTARFHDMVQTDVNSGRHNYDISANFGYPTASGEIRDYTCDLMDKSRFPYFDFSLPCWNQSLVTDTTIAGRLHYVSGFLNLSMIDASCIIWHNKTLYDYEKKDDDPDDLQQYALEGKWTYDDLYRWVQAFYKDNGTASGSRDYNDTYALLACTNDSDPMPRDVFPAAWDLDFVVEQNDETHVFNIVDNERIDTALTRARNLLRGYGTYNSQSAQLFASGKAIFYMQRIYASSDENMRIRQMDDTYTILPMPMYNTDQGMYYTTAQDYFTLMFVLDHSYSRDPIKGKEVSAFLQYANELTYENVLGHYYTRTIQPVQPSTDYYDDIFAKSVTLFGIIIANIKLEYSYVYSAQLNNINHLWRAATAQGATVSLENMYLADKTDFEAAIKSADEWFGLS